MRYEIKGCTRRKRQNSNKWRKSFRIADTGGSGAVRVWHVCVGLVWGSRFAFRMAQTPEESHLHLVTHQNCLSLLINCLHKECIWSCQIVDLPAWFPVGLSFACRLPDLGFCFFLSWHPSMCPSFTGQLWRLSDCVGCFFFYSSSWAPYVAQPLLDILFPSLSAFESYEMFYNTGVYSAKQCAVLKTLQTKKQN